MRGKAALVIWYFCRIGITPAYAGKSQRQIQIRRKGKGSPPPMRGKGEHVPRAVYTGGITPAYAGKSLHVVGLFVNVQDHPRLCGEKNDQTVRVGLYQGSPPPMRGKAILPHAVVAAVGITPAYAGKSRKWTGTQLRTWDHPRLCGEK